MLHICDVLSRKKAADKDEHFAQKFLFGRIPSFLQKSSLRLRRRISFSRNFAILKWFSVSAPRSNSHCTGQCRTCRGGLKWSDHRLGPPFWILSIWFQVGGVVRENIPSRSLPSFQDRYRRGHRCTLLHITKDAGGIFSLYNLIFLNIVVGTGDTTFMPDWFKFP